MTRLDPFQREILRGLEQTGEDYLLPIVLTCGARFPEQPPELMLRITVGSICALMRAGLVEGFRERAGDHPGRRESLSPREVMGLVRTRAVAWDRGRGRWRWDAAIGGDFLVGFQIGAQVLSAP